MIPFGVTIPATVPQRTEIPEGLTNYPVCLYNVSVKFTRSLRQGALTSAVSDVTSFYFDRILEVL